MTDNRKECSCGCGADRWYTRHVVPWWCEWLFVLLLLMLVFWPAHAQYPALRTDTPYVDQHGRSDYTVLRIWAGPIPAADSRIEIWSTSSMSPNATAGSPWDAVGEDVAMWRLTDLPSARDSLGNPMPGWLDIPIERRRIYMPSLAQWVWDDWRRVTIYLGSMTVMFCADESCGARLLVGRTPMNEFPLMSTRAKSTFRPREVVH